MTDETTKPLAERVEEVLSHLQEDHLWWFPEAEDVLREQRIEIERLTELHNTLVVSHAIDRDSLRRDLEAAREDAERLDHIERMRVDFDGQFGLWDFELDLKDRTFRAAIDKARKGE